MNGMAMIQVGDVCKVGNLASIRDMNPHQLRILRDVVRQGGGRVDVEKVVGSYATVSAHDNPISKMVGAVEVPLSALVKVASSLTAAGDVVFHASSRGGRWELVGYSDGSYEDLQHGRAQGHGSGLSRNGLAHKLAAMVQDSKVIDGINYIIDVDRLGVKQLLAGIDPSKVAPAEFYRVGAKTLVASKWLTKLISPTGQEFWEAYGPMVSDPDKATRFTNPKAAEHAALGRFGRAGIGFWESERRHEDMAYREYKDWSYEVVEDTAPAKPWKVVERVKNVHGRVMREEEMAAFGTEGQAQAFARAQEQKAMREWKDRGATLGGKLSMSEFHVNYIREASMKKLAAVEWLKPSGVNDAAWNKWLADVAPLVEDVLKSVRILKVNPQDAFYHYLEVENDRRRFEIGLSDIQSERHVREVKGFLRKFDRAVKAYESLEGQSDPFHSSVYEAVKAYFGSGLGSKMAYKVIADWIRQSGRKLWSSENDSRMTRRSSMNREAVAKELLAIAKLLTGTTGTFKCPECGTKVLENTGYCVKCEKKVKQAAKWESLPEGWTQSSLSSFYKSLAGAGDAKAKFYRCVDKISDTDVTDPNAFCGALLDRFLKPEWRGVGR